VAGVDEMGILRAGWSIPFRTGIQVADFLIVGDPYGYFCIMVVTPTLDGLVLPTGKAGYLRQGFGTTLGTLTMLPGISSKCITVRSRTNRLKNIIALTCDYDHASGYICITLRPRS
jgi:hypothetical protein